jgi:predicted nuclease of predicted toxin-antitoxin system
MKLLLDANLSWRLIKLLSEHFETVAHVDNIGLKVPAKDVEIWQYAQKNNFVIITNDDDFSKLVLQHGFPPQIIMIKSRNQSNKHLFELILKKKNEIESFSNPQNYGILEIY